MEELYYVSDGHSYIIGPKVGTHIHAKIIRHQGHMACSNTRYTWRPYDPSDHIKVEPLV